MRPYNPTMVSSTPSTANPPDSAANRRSWTVQVDDADFVEGRWIRDGQRAEPDGVDDFEERVFAPIPSVSETMATTAKPGLRRRIRKA
ncbi:MAG: hypothetical protein WBC51_10970 [Vicinamibacterales bacterium]